MILSSPLSPLLQELLVPARIQVFLSIEDGMTFTDIRKAAKKTYWYISNTLNVLQELKLISTEKIGRTRICTLTEKGKRVRSGLEIALNELRKTDEIR